MNSALAESLVHFDHVDQVVKLAVEQSLGFLSIWASGLLDAAHLIEINFLKFCNKLHLGVLLLVTVSRSNIRWIDGESN